MRQLKVRSQEGTPFGARRPPTCSWEGEIGELARSLRIWRGGTRRVGCLAITSPGGAGTAEAIDLAAGIPEGEGLDWVSGRARERAAYPVEPLAEACAALLAKARDRAIEGDSAWEAHWDRLIVELAPTLRAVLPSFDWGRPVSRAPALRARLARSRLLDSTVRLILRHGALRPVAIALDAFDRADPATQEAVDWLLEAPARFQGRPESQGRALIVAAWASEASQSEALRARISPFREVRLMGATREKWEGWWRRKREALRPGGVRILQALAVLDRPYPARMIASVLSLHEGDVISQIETLVADGWVRRWGDGTYEIIDRLAIDVALQGLRPEDRRSLASACAWHILSAGQDDLSSFAALAHLAEGGAWEVYQGHARKACSIAEELGVPEQALVAAGRLIDTCRSSEQPVPIEDIEMYGRLLEGAGLADDAVRAYEEWLRGGEAPPTARARAFRRLAELYGRAGERRRELACLDRGLDALSGEAESVERLAIYAELARLGLADADLGESLRWCEVGIDLAELGALDQDEEFREILRITHEVHFRRGEYVEAEAFEKRRLRAARKGDDVSATLESLDGLSGLAFARGDFAGAESWASRALDVANETGSRYLGARALARLARIRARRGADAEALEALDRAQGVLREIREDEDRSGVCDSIGVISLLRGEYERGAASLREAVLARPSRGIGPSDGPFPSGAGRSEEDRCAEIHFHEAELRRAVLEGDEAKEARNRLALGDLLMEAGELDEASAMYLAGSRARESCPGTSRRSLFLVRLARVARLRGNSPQAMAYLTQALDCAAEDDARGTVGAAYIEAGLLFLREGDLSKSLRYLVRVLEICRAERDPIGGFEALLAIAQYLTEIGRSRAGTMCAVAALELVERCGLGSLAMRAHVVAARALRSGGDREGSEAHREVAGRIAAALRPRRDRIELRLEEARAALAEGSFERCMEEASGALAESRGIGTRDLEADALHILGRCHAAPRSGWHDFARARDCLQRAIQMGDTRKLFLAEVESSMASLCAGQEGGENWADAAADRLAGILQGAPPRAAESLRQRRDLSPAVERIDARTGESGVELVPISAGEKC